MWRTIPVSSLPVEDWQKAAQVNSPESVRQVVLYGLAAALLVIGFFVMRFTLTSVADDAPGKVQATPCRRA